MRLFSSILEGLSLSHLQSHFFLCWTISRKKRKKKKRKSRINPSGWWSIYLYFYSLHASLTSQHYNLFELPSVISTPPCWPLLTHSLLVGSAGHWHNQGFVMLSDRLQVTILKQHKDCFLSWYSSSLIFRKTLSKTHEKAHKVIMTINTTTALI